MHLIPKPTGGRRPIAFLATIVRLWERVRKRVVRQRAARIYDWASRARSAGAAAWTQSIYDEAATHDGLVSAAVFFDLVKAFEMIRLEGVWEAGRKANFPVRLLRLIMEEYACARRLTFRKEVAEPVHTLSAILAGSGMAQVALALVLAESLEKSMRGPARETLDGPAVDI